MLHVNLVKKQYLKHSAIWQRYLLDKNLPSEAFTINTKLFTAYYLNQYRTNKLKFQDVLQILSERHKDIKVDYNILRLYAFFNHKNTTDFLHLISQDQKNIIQKFSNIGISIAKKEIFQDPLGLNLRKNDQITLEFLHRFQEQLKGQSEDQIDQMLIAYSPWTTLKLVKLCKISQFFWLEKNTQHFLLEYVNSRIHNGWYNLSTLSIILGRLNKATVSTPFLECLDDLVNFTQKRVNPNLKVRVNFSRDKLQKPDLLSQAQYSNFKKQLIIMLHYLSIRYQLVYTPNDQKQSLLEQIVLIVRKKVNIQKDFGILELIAIHAIIKRLYDVVQDQKMRKSQFYSINLEDNENLFPIIQQLQELISNKNNHLKNKKIEELAEFLLFGRMNKIKYPSSLIQIKKIVKPQIDSPTLFAKNIREIQNLLKLSDYFMEDKWLKHILSKRRNDLSQLQMLAFPTYYQQRQSTFWNQIQKQFVEVEQNKLPCDLMFYLHNQQFFERSYKLGNRLTKQPLLGINSIYDIFRVSSYKEPQKLQQLINSAKLITQTEQQKLKFLLKSSKQQIKLTKSQIRKLYVWRQLLKSKK